MVVVDGPPVVSGRVKWAALSAERLSVVLVRKTCPELLNLTAPDGGHLGPQLSQAVVQINRPPLGGRPEHGALMMSGMKWPVAVQAWRPLTPS